MDRTVFRIAKGSSAARWVCGVIGALILAAWRLHRDDGVPGVSDRDARGF